MGKRADWLRAGPTDERGGHEGHLRKQRRRSHGGIRRQVEEAQHGRLVVWHWMIILAVFVLLFGAKKLPDAARGVGRSLRILKSEVNAMHEDDEKARKVAGETDATAAMATPSGQITGVPAAPIPPHPQSPTITSVTTVNGLPVEEHRT